jgi:SRSO17 transposase
LRRDQKQQPVSVKQLALAVPSSAWNDVAWSEGTERRLRSRFAALRVRPAHRDHEKAEPTKYWVSTLPPQTKLKALVKIAKHRWIIERDHEELKQELGLGHYEGRGWRGFHHHATLCIAAYGFLVAERNRFPAPRRFHPTSSPAARRQRAERHNPHSIATLRIQIARSLLRQLPCCPFCCVRRL